jgi:hypothetical protein
MTTKTTYKNPKMMLLSSVIFTLMFASMGLDHANAEKPADKTDYVSLWKIIDQQRLENNRTIEALELQLTESNDPNVDAEIKQRIADLKVENSKFWEQIDQLEQLNIESYILDPATERKYILAEQKLLDKYMNPESSTYVGKNGVQDITPDRKMREFFVLIDPSEMIQEGATTSEIQSFVDDLKSTIDIDVSVEFGKFIPTSCDDRDDACNPAKGGNQIQRSGVGSGSTLSYKATHGTWGNGFVIAGHEAYDEDETIVQPAGGSTFGTVKVMGGSFCDCAFVKLAAGKSVDNVIWAPEVGSTYDIDTRVDDDEHTAGKFLNLSGVASGVDYGDIVYLTSNNGKINIGVSGGDSGGPLYKPLVSGDADLYGHVIGSAGTGKAYYESWEYTKNDLNLTD